MFTYGNINPSAKLLDLDQLEPSPLLRGHQPTPSPALVTAAKTLGVIDAVICRKLRTADERYEILRNLLSWRAAQEAQLSQVPAVICNVTDDDAAELVNADIENWVEGTESKRLDPITEARKLREEYMAEGGPRRGRISALAERHHVSPALISQKLAFLALPSQIQRLGVNRKLSFGQLRALRGLKEPDQIKLANQAAREGLSVRTILAHAKVMQGPPKIDVDVAAVERMLKDRLHCETKLGKSSVIFKVGGGDVRVLSGLLDNCADALPARGLSTKFDGHKLRITFADESDFDQFLVKMGVVERLD